MQAKELGSIKQDSILVSIKENKLVYTNLKSIEKNTENEIQMLQEDIEENIEIPQENVEVDTEKNLLEKVENEEEK